MKETFYFRCNMKHYHNHLYLDSFQFAYLFSNYFNNVFFFFFILRKVPLKVTLTYENGTPVLKQNVISLSSESDILLAEVGG